MNVEDKTLVSEEEIRSAVENLEGWITEEEDQIKCNTTHNGQIPVWRTLTIERTM